MKLSRTMNWSVALLLLVSVSFAPEVVGQNVQTTSAPTTTLAPTTTKASVIQAAPVNSTTTLAPSTPTVPTTPAITTTTFAPTATTAKPISTQTPQATTTTKSPVSSTTRTPAIQPSSTTPKSATTNPTPALDQINTTTLISANTTKLPAISPAQIIISERIDNETTTASNTSSVIASKTTLFDTLLVPDFMPDDIRNNGGIIVHILLLAYFCLALGIVCDIYFLSSLEFISNGLNLPSDIAGATFMAIGTSAPELFTSLIGVFISHDDIGTGTILGSAVFNVIFIPAVCGFAVWKWCKVMPKISKFAILRDTIFYLITIVTLLLALKDNEIDWVESIAMLGLFSIYILIMYFNAQVSELLQTNEDSEETNEATPLLNSQNAVLVQSTRGEEWEVDEKAGPSSRVRYSSVTDEADEQNWVEASTLTKWVMFPALILFKITLPKPTKYCFFLTFMISILWISVLTYMAVWSVTIIGYTFGIPETISGLTLLAAGTSIPELISSVLVVKRFGLADMALCNTLGSNIFDILIGLGLPWAIKSIIGMITLGTLDPTQTLVPVQSNGLPFTTFSLLITVVAMISTLSAFKWRLGLGVGVTCSIIYVIFLIASSLF